MAEMRKVQLHEGARKRAHGVVSSTYNFENKTYNLVGNQILNVDLVVANAWHTADSNVVIMPEK